MSCRIGIMNPRWGGNIQGKTMKKMKGGSKSKLKKTRRNKDRIKNKNKIKNKRKL
jgi:hypothetical protein